MVGAVAAVVTAATAPCSPTWPLTRPPQTRALRQRPVRTKGDEVEILAILGALAIAGWWLYRAGKRLGSRKGFGAARRRARRRRSRQR